MLYVVYLTVKPRFGITGHDSVDSILREVLQSRRPTRIWLPLTTGFFEADDKVAAPVVG